MMQPPTLMRLAATSRQAILGFALFLPLNSFLPLRADDVLRHVPHDAAGLVSCRNIRELDDQLSKLLKAVKPEFDGLPLADLETTLGFAPGTVDLERRITAIFLHADELSQFMTSEGMGGSDEPFPVIAFSPIRPDQFSIETGSTESSHRIHKRHGIWGNYYFFTHDKTVFVANRRKSLRLLSRLAESDALAGRLDVQAREVFAKSDVFSHFAMAAWRDRMNPYVSMIGNMVQLGIIAQQSPENIKETDAMLKWIIDGAKDAFNQMDSVMVAAQLEGPRIRLFHLHRFDRNRWLSGYLKSVTRSGDEPFQILPDRPFLALGFHDWVCPDDQSLSKIMNERLFSLPGMQKKISKARRDKLTEATRRCARDLHVADYLFCNPTGDLMPFEVFGSYTTRNPGEMLEILEMTHEDSSEAWSILMSGSLGGNGKFSQKSNEGFDYREMRFDQPGMPESLIREVKQAYGEKVCMQLASIGKRHVAYSIAQPPAGVVTLLNATKEGRTIKTNPSIRSLCETMPKDANVMLIVNLGRLVQGAQSLRGWSNGDGSPSDQFPSRLATERSDLGKGKSESQVGPLLGWSCQAGDGSLNCQFVIDGPELATLLTGLAVRPAK